MHRGVAYLAEEKWRFGDASNRSVGAFIFVQLSTEIIIINLFSVHLCIDLFSDIHHFMWEQTWGQVCHLEPVIS